MTIDNIYRMIDKENLRYLTQIGFNGGADCISLTFEKEYDSDSFAEVNFSIYDSGEFSFNVKEYFNFEVSDEIEGQVFDWLVALKNMLGLGVK